MELFDQLMSGFSVAATPLNLLYVTLGVLIGTFVGLLPGLGPTASLALLLPLTFGMTPASAIILMAGIYYGCMYGGRIPAILLNLPGDSSSVVTTFDGYPLTKQGRAGSALGITAIGSFLGGTLAIIGLTLFAPIIANYAVRIGSPELFALTLAGLLMIVFIGAGSKLKALAVAAFGLIIAAVGTDQISGSPRLTFGILDLAGGLDIVPVAVGVFGIGEILYNMDRGQHHGAREGKIANILPTLADWAQSRMAILRASIIGFFIGILPGGGGTVSSIVSYGVEKKMSKTPERFGNGAIEGLAATETADNASSNSAFIPLLTLGIPPNPVLALIFGALMLHNVTPGPRLVNEHPDIFWGVIASMYIGNILLLVFNLPLIGLFVKVLRLRVSILSPLILIIAICGVYSVNNRVFDIGVAIVFGFIGYLFKKWRFELGPFVLAFVLGPILEAEFRRSMLMSEGSLAIFISRPMSGAIFALIAVLVLGSVARTLVARKPRNKMDDNTPYVK